MKKNEIGKIPEHRQHQGYDHLPGSICLQYYHRYILLPQPDHVLAGKTKKQKNSLLIQLFTNLSIQDIHENTEDFTKMKDGFRIGRNDLK